MKISLEMAKDMGLVPRPDVPEWAGMMGSFPFESESAANKRRDVANREHERQMKKIEDKWVVDKKLMLCEFPEDVIYRAASKRL